MVNDSDRERWPSDDDLQDVLDAHKQRIYREPLEMERTLVASGTAEYRRYHSRHDNYEAGGTAEFRLEDAGGTARGTADYSADCLAGVITMTEDQRGTALYLTGWTYDLNGAAAELWRERAGALADAVDVSTGDNKLSRGRLMGQALEMAAHYAQRARARVVRSWNVGLFERD